MGTYDYTIKFMQRRPKAATTVTTSTSTTPQYMDVTIGGSAALFGSMRPFPNGSFVEFQNAGPSSNPTGHWANDVWKVHTNQPSANKVRLVPARSGQTIRAGWIPCDWSALTRRADANGTIPPTGTYSELALLGNFRWNTAYGATSSPYHMCANQNRCRNLLLQFWNDPTVLREYQARKNQPNKNWSGMPNVAISGPNLADSFMAVTRGEASTCGCIERRSRNSLDMRGIYQISPTAWTDAPWWPNDLTLLYDWQYATRAAIYIMFQHTFVPDFAVQGERQSPWGPWDSARNGTAGRTTAIGKFNWALKKTSDPNRLFDDTSATQFRGPGCGETSLYTGNTTPLSNCNSCSEINGVVNPCP